MFCNYITDDLYKHLVVACNHLSVQRQNVLSNTNLDLSGLTQEQLYLTLLGSRVYLPDHFAESERYNVFLKDSFKFVSVAFTRHRSLSSRGRQS